MSIFTCDNKDEFVFDLFPNSKNSYFVDVGAGDGIYGSNTFSLEKRGWNGVCIEAHPHLSNEIKSNRHCVIDDSLVGHNNEIVEFLIQTEEAKIAGVPADKGELTMFGGFSHAWRGGSGILSNWGKEQIEESSKKGRVIKKETKTLTEVLDKINCPTYIEFLDIDTEGNDYNVLLGIDWGKYRFATIMIEEKTKQVKGKLEGLGYTMEHEFSEERLLCGF